MIAQISNKIQDFLYQRGLKDRSLYTDQSQVIAELHRRRALIDDDEKLLKIIKPTPSIQRLIDKPHLVFFRQVATPLHETLRVIEIAKELDLDLCLLEYSEDKMVGAQNHFKYGLARLPVFDKVDKRGDDVFHRRVVSDINSNAGHPIKHAETLQRESLIDFHHELLSEISGIDVRSITVDASDWLLKYDAGASEYYEVFFTIFVKYSVLAEVFQINNKFEGHFTKKVIRPAFSRVISKHDFQPLIINYQPADEQDRMYWDCYPKETDDFLRRKGYIE